MYKYNGLFSGYGLLSDHTPIISRTNWDTYHQTIQERINLSTSFKEPEDIKKKPPTSSDFSKGIKTNYPKY